MKLNIGKPLAILSLALAPHILSAQAVTMFGALSNFDVINDTGQETHGFEIEIQGATSVAYTFSANRYGSAKIVPFANGGGVYVRYMASWDPIKQTWSATTPIATNFTPTNGHQCVLGTPNYNNSGCEHFGVGYYNGGSNTIYRWLLADPNNPGQLIPNGTPVSIPAPIWSIQPPAAPGLPPVVIADVPAPAPPPPAKLYGPAQWMKTFKTENGRQVGLDELVADNAVVPMDPAQIETAWEIVQQKIGDGPGKRKKKGNLGANHAAVVRRFELYKYNGVIDPITGQALCSDPTCTVPADGEVGDFIGAQNAAANLNLPPAYPVDVTIVGDGQVTSSTRSIQCPGTVCSTSIAPGGSITLTASNRKGVFSGWSGACNGTATTCTINVNSAAPVTATFLNVYKLVLKNVGKGSIVSNPSGSSFLDGTNVTLTAKPQTGAIFLGWSGACSGTALTCTVTITADTTVQANFQ